jgi:AcrR family transcriptional regulator
MMPLVLLVPGSTFSWALKRPLTGRRLVPRKKREPEKTLEEILSVATKLFAAKGPDGTRMEDIATKAHVSKGLPNYHFPTKEDIYREVFARKLADLRKALQETPVDPSDALVYWYNIYCRDPDVTHLLQWEALKVSNGGELVNEEERQTFYKEAASKVREAHSRGLLSSDLNSEHMVLAIIALASFPVAYPNFTKLITGRSPDDPSFQEEQIKFLRILADKLKPNK